MNWPFLDQIHSPQDIQSLSLSSLEGLAEEIRSRIIKVLSVNGGHLASNLGIVELTLSLHAVFSSPVDKLIFDTSHQTYVHKLITARHSSFSSLRKWKGLCGFSHPKESPHDPFYCGHAGTALSLALGVAKNRDLSGRNEHVLAIIGDGTLTCGLTLEALNNIPKNLGRFLLILNDNEMAISKNVGNITNILSRLLSNPTSNKVYQDVQQFLGKIPGYGPLLAKQGQKITESIKNLVSPASFFEHFGLSYVGPVDGHNLSKLIETFSALKDSPRPVIVHVLTTKGKGMVAATQNPTPYHGAKPFDMESGKFLTSPSPSFPQIFGKHLAAMAESDPSLVVLTPAMGEGSCLGSLFKNFPQRCFDVGIAESHCVTFAAGLAFGKKMKVVVSIYATFLQRAFDNLFHDVCLQELPIVFAIDRSGINGPDGCSHHGIYDISFLQAMPNMTIVQPRNGHVLKELMDSAFTWQRPVALRYPNLSTEEPSLPIQRRELGKGEILSYGKKLLIIGLGTMALKALEVKNLLAKEGLDPTIVDPVFVKPLDSELFYDLLHSHPFVVTLEEHSVQSGFGSIFNSFVLRNGFHNEVLNIGIPDAFVQHGDNLELYKELGLDVDSIASKIINEFDLIVKGSKKMV